MLLLLVPFRRRVAVMVAVARVERLRRAATVALAAVVVLVILLDVLVVQATPQVHPLPKEQAAVGAVMHLEQTTHPAAVVVVPQVRVAAQAAVQALVVQVLRQALLVRR
jgi:hypothetical protein